MKITNTMIGLCIAFIGLVEPASTQPKMVEPDISIDAPTIAKYKRLGAEYGGWGKEIFRMEFQVGRDTKTSRLPGFQVNERPNGPFPDVSVPFGLGFSRIVNNGSIKHLASLRHLALLDLSGSEVTDNGIREISQLKSLRTLYLCQTEVTNAGLKELTNLSNLFSLDISGSEITDEGLKYLTQLKELSNLSIGPYVSDAGLKHLIPLKRLSVLSVRSGEITDSGLEQIAAMEGLSAIKLTCPNATCAGLKVFGRLKKLRFLQIYVDGFAEADVKHLAILEQLETLVIVGANINVKAVEKLRKALPKCNIHADVPNVFKTTP
jgi:hypothetical protein